MTYHEITRPRSLALEFEEYNKHARKLIGWTHGHKNEHIIEGCRGDLFLCKKNFQNFLNEHHMMSAHSATKA